LPDARCQGALLEGKWKAYPSVSQIWRRNWARITPFFNYPPDIRKAIYTTNSVESLNQLCQLLLGLSRRARAVNQLQIGRHRLARFPGHVVQRSPHQMYDA
jgi:transposase-like protein